MEIKAREKAESKIRNNTKLWKNEQFMNLN